MKRLALIAFVLCANLLPASDELLDRIENTNQHVVALKVVRNKKTTHGAGLIFAEKRLVITNYHVIHDNEQISGKLANGQTIKLTLLNTSKKRDLAVLQIEAGIELPKTEIKLASKCRLGEEVYAIGNPFGLGHSVTVGRVSALQREIPGVDDAQLKNIIQHSADLNPGNSGGPLFNSKGEVIGINTAIYERGRGISFAVSSDDVQTVLSKVTSPTVLASSK